MTDIIVISGKQGSGKSTTATELVRQAMLLKYDFAGAEKFADPLYALHDTLLNRLETLTGIPRVKKNGPLLQYLGTELGRSIDPNIWVNILKRKVESYSSEKTHRLVIIDDARFENEFDAFPEALRVRLDCPAEQRKPRTDSWRENENHPSETGLDEYAAQGKFDLTVFTGEVSGFKSSPEHVANLILSELRRGNWKEGRA